MLKVIDSLAIMLISASMLMVDHHYGSKFVWNVCQVVGDASKIYISDTFIGWIVGLLVLFSLIVIMYLRRLDKKYVALTCTPQITLAEYEYLTKKTTIEKMQQLKKMPEYEEVLRNYQLRESYSPRNVITSQQEIRSTNRMSNGQVQETIDRTVYSRRSVPGL